MNNRISQESDRVAFAFPGVGVKLCGREADFFHAHRDVMGVFLEEAGAAVGIDFPRTLAKGAVDQLPDQAQQYFTYAFSAGVGEVWRRAGVEPTLVAGFSFGIYAALYCAGAVGFSDGHRMLGEAYGRMAEVSRGQGGGVAVMVGLSRDDAEGLIRDGAYDTIALTNESNESCFVFSGSKEQLAKLLDAARSRDAFSADLLDVDIPYHHPTLLGDVSTTFGVYIDSLAWHPSRCPVVSSIDQSLLTDPRGLKRLVAENLTTPISWLGVVGAFNRHGITGVFECGPGVSLTQSGRFMPYDIEYVNLKKARRWLTR